MTTMPNFTPSQMEGFVSEALDRASAPPRSSKFNTVPELVEKIVLDGDEVDAWLFLSGLVFFVIEAMGLNQLDCPCGNPEHKPEVQFGFTERDNPGRLYIGGDETPEELRRDHPEVVCLARIVTAEIKEDEDTSRAAWLEAVQGGWTVKVIYLALRQAGEVYRHALARGGVN
jgi:hypothetical protein